MRRRRKGGTQNQALGRSRGGFSTKIHLRTNAEGLALAVQLTPGEAHDSTAYADLMADHGTNPEVLLADRGYDSDAIRDDVRSRGGTPEIPTKQNRLVQVVPPLVV
jgi:transposase